MEKKSGDSFHYFHFLRNAADSERKGETPGAVPPATTQTPADELFKQIAG